MWDKVLGAVVVAVATEIAREVIKEDNQKFENAVINGCILFFIVVFIKQGNNLY